MLLGFISALLRSPPGLNIRIFYTDSSLGSLSALSTILTSASLLLYHYLTPWSTRLRITLQLPPPLTWVLSCEELGLGLEDGLGLDYG
jgi:hypothetical protein